MSMSAEVETDTRCSMLSLRMRRHTWSAASDNDSVERLWRCSSLLRVVLLGGFWVCWL